MEKKETQAAREAGALLLRQPEGPTANPPASRRAAKRKTETEATFRLSSCAASLAHIAQFVGETILGEGLATRSKSQSQADFLPFGESRASAYAMTTRPRFLSPQRFPTPAPPAASSPASGSSSNIRSDRRAARSDPKSLLHPRRQLTGAPPRGLTEPDPFQARGDILFSRGRSRRPAEEEQVLGGREVLVEGEVRPGPAKGEPPLPSVQLPPAAANAHRSRARACEAGEDLQKRRLTAAVGACDSGQSFSATKESPEKSAAASPKDFES